MMRWLPLLALLAGCSKPEPTFPAPTEPTEPHSALECRLLQEVFPRLIAGSPKGNVVLSPYALAAAIAKMRGEKSAGSRYGSRQWLELEGADVDVMHANRVRHDSLIGPPPKRKAAARAPLGSDFIERERARLRESGPAENWLALFDAQVAGVPMVSESRSLFRPAPVEFAGRLSVPGTRMSFGAQYGVSSHFRSAFWAAESRESWLPARLEYGVVVTFSLPVNEADAPPALLPVLPCAGGGLPQDSRQVGLELVAPTFCARTRIALGELAPELSASLPADVQLSARLGFDARGTINLPPHAVRSPSSLLDFSARRSRHELHMNRPFFVTVHDRTSGSILYVAFVREANDVTDCR